MNRPGAYLSRSVRSGYARACGVRLTTWTGATKGLLVENMENKSLPTKVATPGGCTTRVSNGCSQEVEWISLQKYHGQRGLQPPFMDVVDLPDPEQEPRPEPKSPQALPNSGRNPAPKGQSRGIPAPTGPRNALLTIPSLFGTILHYPFSKKVRTGGISET